jgi:hypothetical protein
VAASKLKRVSEQTEKAITTMAESEDRTFVAQLERVVEAGLDALGYTSDGVPKSKPRKRAGASTG